MGAKDEQCFDVYVRSRWAVVTVVRHVSFRTAHSVARQRADEDGQPVYIRNQVTSAVETVWPSPNDVA